MAEGRARGVAKVGEHGLSQDLAAGESDRLEEGSGGRLALSSPCAGLKQSGGLRPQRPAPCAV